MFTRMIALDSPTSRLRSLLVPRFTFTLDTLGLAGLGVLVLAWIRMLVSPAPQEMREGAMMWSTIAFLSGENPYAVDALPGTANVYGPLYPALVAVAAAAIGPTLFAHRLVNAVGITIACALLYRVVRREGASPRTALIGAALNLAGLLYWVGPTSRPDGIGMALSMGAYSVMAPAPTKPRRVSLGIFLSMAGFATKVYYVLPAVAVVVCLLWMRDVRRAMTALCAAGVALVATAGGLTLVFPTWAPVVLGANLQATTYDVEHLVRQARDWAIFSTPLLVALLAAWRPWRAEGRQRVVASEPGTSPFWAAALAVGVTAILLALGGHRGAHMTYFFHLVSPALTVLALRHLDTCALPRLAFAASLPVAVVANAHWFTLDLTRFDRAEATFARLSQSIGRAHRPTGTGEFAPLLLAAGVTPVETGHTEYLRHRVGHEPDGRFSTPATLEAEARRVSRSFYAAVHEGSFDLVVSNRRRLDLLTPDVLWPSYRVLEQIEVDMPWAQQAWPVDVWVPRLGRAESASTRSVKSREHPGGLNLGSSSR